MAASSTPVKCLYFSSDIQACVLCAKKLTKRLHCLGKFRSTKLNYVKIIEQFTGLVLDPSLLYEMYVCETCVGKCQSFMDFKRRCVDSIENFESTHKRLKRLPKTPPSSLRQSVVEQIESSVVRVRFRWNKKNQDKNSHLSRAVTPKNQLKTPSIHLHPTILITASSSQLILKETMQILRPIF